MRGHGAGNDDHDTGSIITMTSDERVQIYVPSPLETTPYNTITRHVEQVFKLDMLSCLQLKFRNFLTN